MKKKAVVLASNQDFTQQWCEKHGFTDLEFIHQDNLNSDLELNDYFIIEDIKLLYPISMFQFVNFLEELKQKSNILIIIEQNLTNTCPFDIQSIFKVKCFMKQTSIILRKINI